MKWHDTIFQWQKIKDVSRNLGNSINFTNYPRPPSIFSLNKKDRTEVKKEAIKEVTKEHLIHTKKLDSLIHHSNNVLLRIHGVFPFDFFPDIVSIECHQINIVRKAFFLSRYIQSIPIKNIADVMIQTSPFFASLHVVDRSYVENTVSVNYLLKEEALCARRIIQGLVLASKEGIDVTKLDSQELRSKVEELGTARLAE